MKILEISYILEQTNFPITSDLIENIIKEIHIFNNIVLTLKLYIIKALPKSDIAIV